MAGDEDSREGRDPAPAVTRSIRLLGLLAQAQPRTLTELAGELGLAKSSTANLCLALEAGGMIQRTSAGYRLGLRTAELGGAFAAHRDDRQVGRECFDVDLVGSESVERVANRCAEFLQIDVIDAVADLFVASE